MPWKECRKMDKKFRFVSRFPDGETLPQEGAHVCATFLQKRTVGRRIAGESAKEQNPQPVSAGARSAFCLYSLHRSLWLQPRKKITKGDHRIQIVPEGVTKRQFPTN